MGHQSWRPLSRRTRQPILRLPEPVADSALVRGDNPIKPGEAVVVVGFPLQGLLSSQASVTAGIISRLAGPRDDPHQLQVTAPVQPGNSGSPPLDASGAVAGVVVAKLNALRFVKRTGAIPENVNFAVNGQYARALLDRSGVPYQTATADEALSTPAIAEHRSSSQSWCNASDENPSDEPGKQPDYLVPKRRSPASPSPGRM